VNGQTVVVGVDGSADAFAALLFAIEEAVMRLVLLGKVWHVNAVRMPVHVNTALTSSKVRS
jgi:hypothetical protein